MAKNNNGRILKNPFDKQNDVESPIFDDEIMVEAMKKVGYNPSDPKARMVIARLLEELKQIHDNDPDAFYDMIAQIQEESEDSNQFIEEPPISEKEWTLTHPFQLKCGSDKFYASVATEIMRDFKSLNLEQSIPKGVLRISAKSAAAYLEDIISETGIWNAVRTMYRKKYNRILPFYNVDSDDYFEDDLNYEDIKILVWQAFNRCGKYYERAFSPLSKAVESMATIAYDILIDRFEKAKPAKRVKDRIISAFKTGDYFELRTIGLWLNADNPLTAAPFMREWMLENAYHTIKHLSNFENLEILEPETGYYNEEARQGWKRYMSLNGCGSNELLSEIADQYGYQELSVKLLTIKEIPFDEYKIDKAEGKCVTLSNHLGKSITVSKDSFRAGVDWKNMKTVFCTLYKFGDEYMSNGMSSFSPKALDWADDDERLSTNNEPFIQRSAETVVQNKGRRVFYCKNISEVQKIMGNDMTPFAYDKKEAVHKDDLSVHNLLLMLSSTDGPILKDNCCYLFKDPKNPFYLGRNIPEIEMGGFSFIYNEILPDDIIDYIVDRKLLPNAFMYASQGKRVGKRIVQDNMGFLMRFNRVSGYPHPDDHDLDNFDFFEE